MMDESKYRTDIDDGNSAGNLSLRSNEKNSV